jgi:hypothetical protein
MPDRVKGARMETINYVLRIVAVLLDLGFNAMLIYFAIRGVPTSRGKIISLAIGIVLMTASLGYMALHPPKHPPVRS